jgi:hypothetical protein
MTSCFPILARESVINLNEGASLRRQLNGRRPPREEQVTYMVAREALDHQNQ